MTGSAFSYKVTITNGTTGATRTLLFGSKAQALIEKKKVSGKDTVVLEDLNSESKSDD